MSRPPPGGPAGRGDLPPWLWLGLPAGACALALLLPLTGEAWWQVLVASERWGYIENATVLEALAAAVFSGLVLRRRR